MRKAQIGAALDSLVQDVRDQVYTLAVQARDNVWPPMVAEQYRIALLKQAVDSPARARAQLQDWIARYNARNGAGSSQTLLAECLTAAGSAKTLASISTEIQVLEAQAAAIVANVHGGWTWDQVSAAILSSFAPEDIDDFTYLRLPVPAGYVTVWGEPW